MGESSPRYYVPSSPTDFTTLPQEAEFIIDMTLSSPTEEDDSFEFVESPPQDYICQVCLNVLREPHITDCCGQHFCRICLDSCVNEYTKTKTCPHCRETRFKHLIYKPFQRKINELVVYCTNKDKGCPEILKLKEIKKHLSAENNLGCCYVVLACPNDCKEKIRRMEMEKHCSETCINRKVTCAFCGIKTIHYLQYEHVEMCEKYPVSCRNGCDQDNLLRCDLLSHDEVCPKKLVKCPFFEVGCTKEVLREEMASHVERNIGDHMSKMMIAYSSLKKELVVLKMGPKK